MGEMYLSQKERKKERKKEEEEKGKIMPEIVAPPYPRTTRPN